MSFHEMKSEKLSITCKYYNLQTFDENKVMFIMKEQTKK